MKRTVRTLLAAALACLSACDGAPADTASRTAGPMPGVRCVGATLAESSWEEHPTMRRGIVYALPEPSARTWLERLGLIGRAHALRLEAEKPAPGASVTLTRPSSPGASLVRATTDAQGRFCMKPPVSLPADAPVLLTARLGERTLRHVSFHASDADISSHSEALVRLYAATPIDVESLSLAQALNIRTMSDTAVGLFGGGFAEVVAEEEPEALIASIIEAMRRDERVTAALARASEGSEQ